MNSRKLLWTAFVVCCLCGCATTNDEATVAQPTAPQPKSNPVYRTGSRLPVPDSSGAGASLSRDGYEDERRGASSVGPGRMGH